MNMYLEKNGLLWVVLALLFYSGAEAGNLVFNVQHRYGSRGSGRRSTLADLKAHDAQRHGRFLAAIDLPLGGNGRVTGSGLFYTKLSIGTPPKDFYVQVDTGSDILWVSCAGCEECPKKSDLGMDLNMYDLKASSTGKLVTCDQEICNMIYNTPNSTCKAPKSCDYSISYADGSTMSGSFVTDTVQFDEVTGNNQTNSTTGTVSFGCSSKQSGTQGTATDRVGGIVGFGQGNSSMISQLAAAGKVQRMFSHCLDSNNGGGIFAIGQVVDTKFNTTPLVEDFQHYNVMMKKAEVEGEIFDIPTESFFDIGRKTVIDSGATLAHLPGDVYDLIISKVTARQSNLKTHVVDPDLKCFFHDGKIEDSFPPVTFHFHKSLSMEVSPREYLLHLRANEWCFGFQRGGMQTDDGDDLILLGDIVLSNKLVVYDLQNLTVGWTPYNCSSSIKVKDESGNVNSVSAHDISSAYISRIPGKLLSTAPLLLMATLLAIWIL